MSNAFLRLSFSASVLLLIAGCGGSSGGGSGGSGGGGGGGSSTTVTFTVTGTTPTVVATRMGTGSFTAATPSSTGTVTLTLPSGTTDFAVAFLCPALTQSIGSTTYSSSDEHVFEASALDGTSFSEPCPANTSAALTGSTGTLTGTVDATAIPGASAVFVEAGSGSQSVSAVVSGTGQSFSLTAPAGTDRVLAFTHDLQLTGYVETTSLSAARNFPAQTVPGALNGGQTVVLGPADEAVSEPITYTNVPSGFSVPTTWVTYEMDSLSGLLLNNAATTRYGAMPAGAVESGDFYSFASTTYNGQQGLLAATTTPTGGPLAVTFPAPWSYAGPTPAARPTFNFASSGFSGTTGLYETVRLYWQASSTAQSVIEVFATGNAQAGFSTLAVPDLSGVQGSLAPPASGTNVGWEAQIAQGSFPLLSALPSSGALTGVFTTGMYVVP